jgi:hypothetical protein
MEMMSSSPRVLIAEGRHVSHRPDLVRFRRVTSARLLVMSRRHRAFREPTLDLSKVNVRFSFQGPRQFTLRCSALGSRILLAGFSSSTSFLPSGSFLPDPRERCLSFPMATLSRSEARRGVPRLSPWPAVSEPSLTHHLATCLRLSVWGCMRRARCSSVLGPSSGCHLIRSPPEPPNVRASCSQLRGLRQGVSLFFFTKLNPLGTELQPDGSRI